MHVSLNHHLSVTRDRIRARAHTHTYTQTHLELCLHRLVRACNLRIQLRHGHRKNATCDHRWFPQQHRQHEGLVRDGSRAGGAYDVGHSIPRHAQTGAVYACTWHMHVLCMCVHNYECGAGCARCMCVSSGHGLEHTHPPTQTRLSSLPKVAMPPWLCRTGRRRSPTLSRRYEAKLGRQRWAIVFWPWHTRTRAHSQAKHTHDTRAQVRNGFLQAGMAGSK